MANTKISALTANTNPTGNEELVYALNNANGKMTLDTMKTFSTAGTQPELVSGTNIKTINGESLLGSGNLVIGGGGGGSGGEISLNAIENIAAGTLVSFNGTGVKKLRRGFYGTASTGISLTVNTQNFNRIDSVLVNNNTVVVSYISGLDDLYVVAIQRNGETRTVGTPVLLSNDAGGCKICCPYEGEFVVLYRGTSNYPCVTAGSVSGTTITVGTEVSLVSANVNGIGISKKSDTDTREFVVFYTKDSDKYLYSNFCSYSSALAITAGTEAIVKGNTSTKNYMGVGYLGNGNVGIIWEYKSSTTYYTDFIYANISGSSLVGYNNSLHIYSSTTESLIGYSPKIIRISDELCLLDVGEDGSMILVRGFSYAYKPIIIQQISPNQSMPIMGRSYCCEDSNRGIVGAFVNNRDYSGTYKLSYSRYRCTELGFEFISKIEYDAVNTNTIPTVTRLGNTSVCSYIDGVNNVLGNLLYQDESDIFAGAISSAATSGNAVDVTYNGIVTTAGLTAGLPLYIGLDGTFSQTGEYGGKQIGIATGSTDALLK